VAPEVSAPTLDDEQARLLAWGERVRRDLPWRATRDPWAILLAEVMAQQTQVDRVVPRWLSFLERWPSPSDFAAAPLAEVLDAWAGLGYPRRARNLWLAAQHIRDRHRGRVPDRLDELLALPGVGPYTARAVLAFAHELDAAVVDTNVGRVLARRAGVRLSPSVAQVAADGWMPSGHGWAWNQTLLDLGALRCRPAAPVCEDCPIRVGCAWFAAGRPEPDPAAGSAGVSRRQARYEGSLRQVRGTLLDAARRGPVDLGDRDEVDVDRAVRSLLEDGLAELDADGRLTLPTG
jgi:A/G-specific adenine glycosylase